MASDPSLPNSMTNLSFSSPLCQRPTSSTFGSVDSGAGGGVAGLVDGAASGEPGVAGWVGLTATGWPGVAEVGATSGLLLRNPGKTKAATAPSAITSTTAPPTPAQTRPELDLFSGSSLGRGDFRAAGRSFSLSASS